MTTCCERCNEYDEGQDGEMHPFCKTRTCSCHIEIGSHVKKKSGMKFLGIILAIYSVPHEERQWCVVLLDKNEASDHLQHLYPLDLFELV